MKVFVVGLPKSGTTTLTDALRRSGHKPLHWRCGLTGNYAGPSIYLEHTAGRDPLGLLKNYDCVTQADYISRALSCWPQMDVALLRSVRKHHPDCWFLLNARDPAKIINSIKKWKNSRLGSLWDRLRVIGAPGLPAGAADSDQAIQSWIENHYARTRKLFADDPRFLEYDIEASSAPEVISNAMGIRLRWWGASNKSKDTK